jgi:hypothetical protein
VEREIFLEKNEKSFVGKKLLENIEARFVRMKEQVQDSLGIIFKFH